MRSKNQRRTEHNIGERPAIAHDASPAEAGSHARQPRVGPGALAEEGKAEKQFRQAEVSGDRLASPRDVSKVKKSKRRK